jgi:hypothetical protein
MTEAGPPLRSITGRRISAAFAAVLALFAAALAVELVTLRKIADAEADVARLDHAKHAGHMAAAQVREQYIHQAHTLIEFGPGHLGHYRQVVAATRASIEHLQAVAETRSDRQLAKQIAELAEQNDRDFRTTVIPAITRGDRAEVANLGAQLRPSSTASSRSMASSTRTSRRGAWPRAAAPRCFAIAR